MNPALMFLRYVNLTLSVCGIIFFSYYYIKCKQPGAIAPLTWLVNLTLFYIYLLINLNESGYLPPDFIEVTNTWSSLLHTHAAILLVTSAWIIINQYCSKKGNK